MIFNAEEILKIAEQMERNGIVFYETAAERFSGEARRTLLRLADMERTHEEVFAGMRRELVDADSALNAFDPDGDTQRYLAAFADGQIFDLKEDPVALLGTRDSIREILAVAVELEKDSVIFYVTFKDAVPESLGKAKVEKIIKEEMDHILLLRGMLSSLDE